MHPVSSSALDVSSQWLSLNELVEAVASEQRGSLRDARQGLANLLVENVRPLLVERHGVCVVVTDQHDRKYDNLIRASLVIDQSEFCSEMIATSVYCEFSFTVDAVLNYIEQRQLVIKPATLTSWKKWLVDVAPSLRAQGLLYKASNDQADTPAIEKPDHMTIDEACDYIGVGRTLFDAKVRSHVDIIDLGHRTKRVTLESLEDFIAGTKTNNVALAIQENDEDLAWSRKSKYLRREVIQGKGLSGVTTRGTSINALADVEFGKALAQLKEQLPKDG